MRLPKDLLSENFIKPRIFLCEVDKERICQLETTNTNGTFKFNSYSEISFEVGRMYTDLLSGETKVNPHYDKIEAPRIIEIDGIGYFELQGPELTSDGIQEKKSCTAYSLEYTMSTKYLEDFIVNTGAIGSIEVTYAEDVAGNINNITPVTLYNPTIPKLSLLHLVLESAYGWSIGHVDSSLATLSRTFEVDRESIYDFLMNEVCEKFNCYIVFDTTDNTINVYAESLTTKFIGDGQTKSFVLSPPFSEIGTVSVDGYKTTEWEYNVITATLTITSDAAPESGSVIEVVDGALTEWETDVFITFENLSQEINISYDAEAIKTRLNVTYGDNDGDIREVNLGMPYLTDISYYYTVEWMGQDLYDAYTTYMQTSNELQPEYTNISKDIVKLNDEIYYHEHRLSLEYSLVQSVNSSTVGTYYIRQEDSYGSYYYTEVTLPADYNANENYYSKATTNVNEEKIDKFYSVLKKYFNNENTDSDKITSWKTDLDELEDDFEFVEDEFNTMRNALSNVTKDRTFVFAIESFNDNANNTNQNNKALYVFLSQVWDELGRTPLKQLYLESYQYTKDINIQNGMSNPTHDTYGYYHAVLLLIASIEDAIIRRDASIQQCEKAREKLYDDRNELIKQLTLSVFFETYCKDIGLDNDEAEAKAKQMLIRLNAFLREDELHLDDIVETSQDDLTSSIKVKYDAMESGRIELQKICQPQLQFSMTMANIYALPEFEQIIDKFQLGNVIKVGLRKDYMKQSRLLQVNLNFDDFSDFSCEFGELTNWRTQSDIHADLLKNAITAGKSVASNSARWTRGADAVTDIELKIQKGLLDATTQIKAIDGNQGVVIDKNGIWLTKINNKETGEIDDRQIRLVNNMIVMSDDGFKTSKTAFGEYKIPGEANSRYGILAEAVFSGYIEGSKIVGGTINIGNGNFTVDSSGNVNILAGKIDGYATSSDLTNLSNDVAKNVPKDKIISSINASTEGITISGEKISLVGRNINLTSENISINSTNFSVTTDGRLISKSGTIANWNITNNKLYSNKTGMAATGADGHVAFWAGYSGDKDTPFDDTNWNSNTNFYVLNNGSLYASSANISGTINADKGYIGGSDGWTINSKVIYNTVTVNETAYSTILSAYTTENTGSRVFRCTTGYGTNNESDLMTIRRDGSVTSYKGFYLASSAHLYGYDGSNYKPLIGMSSGNNLSIGATDQSFNTYINVGSGKSICFAVNGTNEAWVKDDGLHYTAASQSSDQRKKNSIKNLDCKYTQLLDHLSAKTYKFNEHRTHITNCGFIAQDVLSALFEAGLTKEEFGGFVDVNGDGTEYELDYTQFIPIMWEEIKSLRDRIFELENTK